MLLEIRGEREIFLHNETPPPPSGGPIVGADSRRCLDVPNASQTHSTRAQLRDFSGGTKQQ
ncbi:MULTISPECIES: RICIN domain-containing protein [Streptomyces]|uniref:Endo-1,4-Beta-Xylanase n=1 Tax=Streptomyces bottropensis ATCC 25435 TaxID=1054862 RepID=M3EXC0_9ACTN|nr:MULTISPECIES: RICIN domain-containing protein [Streptomyces]EMF53798.1 Endo-1,4-Beta-Xylanase [Streptomyces bottropensis ATCC 25435]MZD17797.1 endo-1,4-beta-xylanase [Streptomyces sp. SID5476]